MEKKNDEDFVNKIMNEESKEGEIKNVGVLNLKDISEEEVEKIKKIQNIGILIVPEKFMGRIAAKITKNIGVVVPYIDGMKLYAGKTNISADTLRNFEEPVAVLNAGKLVFEEDVTPELIRDKIKNYRNYGKTTVPSAAYGILMSKCSENMGKIVKTEDDDDE